MKLHQCIPGGGQFRADGTSAGQAAILQHIELQAVPLVTLHNQIVTMLARIPHSFFPFRKRLDELNSGPPAKILSWNNHYLFVWLRHLSPQINWTPKPQSLQSVFSAKTIDYGRVGP